MQLFFSLSENTGEDFVKRVQIEFEKGEKKPANMWRKTDSSHSEEKKRLPKKHNTLPPSFSLSPSFTHLRAASLPARVTIMDPGGVATGGWNVNSFALCHECLITAQPTPPLSPPPLLHCNITPIWCYSLQVRHHTQRIRKTTIWTTTPYGKLMLRKKNTWIYEITLKSWAAW